MNQPTDSFDFLHQPFCIADWTVDPATHRLYRSDTEVRLEPRMMALLVCLAQHPGEPVSREELESLVWGRSVVGYDALTGSINKLRKALGDDSRKPRFIETVSKKGYRLIAPVTPIAPSPGVIESSPVRPVSSRLWPMVGGLVLLALLITLQLTLQQGPGSRFPAQASDRPSIAVLPFGNLGNDPSQTYLSEGISADLTTAISKISGLSVVASAPTQSLRDSGDVKQAAQALEVRYVLVGNVRRIGNQLRVNVQLVDGTNGFQIWAERYDRNIEDLLDVQDDITAKIVSALSVKLTEAEKLRTAQRYTVNIAAYDDFLRGQSLYVRGTPQDNLQARTLFEEATALDPGFARAYGAMARTYVDEFRFGMGQNPALLAQALQLAQKTVALDDQLPQAFHALGYVQLHRHEYQRASVAIERAIALDPNDTDSHALLALIQMYSGDYEKAVGTLRKMMGLNPLYPARYAAVLGQTYYFLGRYEDAITTLRDATERNTGLLSPYIFYTAALSHLGRKDEAAWAATLVRAQSHDFSLEHLSGMFPHKDPEKLQMLVDDLKQAGL